MPTSKQTAYEFKSLCCLKEILKGQRSGMLVTRTEVSISANQKSEFSSLRGCNASSECNAMVKLKRMIKLMVLTSLLDFSSILIFLC